MKFFIEMKEVIPNASHIYGELFWEIELSDNRDYPEKKEEDYGSDARHEHPASIREQSKEETQGYDEYEK